MADEEQEGTEEGAEKKEDEKKGGKGAGIIGMVLPAILAGGAAFGGAFFAGGAPAPVAVTEAEGPNEKMPGPTVPLNAFVMTVPDQEGASHPAKVTFAIELKHGVDPKGFEVFVPRIRDTILSYMSSLQYEDMSDGKRRVKLTEDLLAAIHKLGAEDAARVLVQDYVVQ